MGTGVATLGDREVPVAAGATIYVPQGQWHGLRNNSQEVLGMTAIYSPAGFEQISRTGCFIRTERPPTPKPCARSTASFIATVRSDSCG